VKPRAALETIEAIRRRLLLVLVFSLGLKLLDMGRPVEVDCPEYMDIFLGPL
jgi:hypothetical protein